MTNRRTGLVCGGKGRHAEGCVPACNERVLGRGRISLALSLDCGELSTNDFLRLTIGRLFVPPFLFERGNKGLYCAAEAQKE